MQMVGFVLLYAARGVLVCSSLARIYFVNWDSVFNYYPARMRKG